MAPYVLTNLSTPKSILKAFYSCHMLVNHEVEHLQIVMVQNMEVHQLVYHHQLNLHMLLYVCAQV